MAVLIEQYVGRFEIAVQYARRVHVVGCVGELVDDVFAVEGVEEAVADGAEEIAVEAFEDQVEILVGGGEDLFELDDVVVCEFAQEDDFAVDALGIYFVLEGQEDLLYGEHLVGIAVAHLPDVPVGATAEFLYGLVVPGDGGLQLLVLGVWGCAFHFEIINSAQLRRRLNN